MTDVIVSADTVTRPVAPPTVHVELPAPSAPADEMLPSDPQNVVTRRLPGEPIHLDETGEALRQEIRSSRERAAEPLVEWSAKNMPIPGDSESTAKQIKRASESMTLARRAVMADQLVKDTGGLVDPTTAAAAVDATVDAPPVKVLPVADAGPDGLPAYPIEALRDDQPIREADSFRNLNEAKRAMSNFRDAQERYQQELIAQFSAKQAEDAKAAADLERAAQQAATKPQPAPQPAPQQPDPFVANVRAVEQQIVHADRQSAHEQQQIQQWAVATFPPEVLRDSQARAELQRTDPNAAEWLRIADQRFAQLQQHRQQLRQVDAGQKIQIASHLQSQAASNLKQHIERQDSEFQRLLEQELPEFSKGQARQELMKAALKQVENQPDILASYHQGGPARDAAVQMTIARSAAWQVAQARARNLNAHKRVPPVQQPGTYQPRSAGDIDQVRALERQLDGATGQQALKIARQLTQARRAAGLL